MDIPVEVVVFSVQSLLVGAYAGQVEEVFRSEAIYADSDDGFFSFLYRGREGRGIDFAFWLTQHGSGECHYWWQENTKNRLLAATLLIVKHASPAYRGVRIDKVEEFMLCPLDRIHTLPVIMQRMTCTPALWGIARTRECLIPLIDLSKLVIKQNYTDFT